jgi:hypothetical protein
VKGLIAECGDRALGHLPAGFAIMTRALPAARFVAVS